MRRFYNLVFPVAFLLLLPGYLRRMIRRGHYRRHFWQRFGFYSLAVRQRLAALPSPVWLQAVSVGEMLVALKLAATLRARDPHLPLVLSTTTTTGYALAAARAPADVEVLYTPVDLLGAVRRTFSALRPSQLVIVDGGLWPNQLWEARRLRLPTALVNARLSPRSERRFRRFQRVASSLFGLLDLVCVPAAGDLARWRTLGVSADRLCQTGSIKFDDAPAEPSSQSTPPLSPDDQARSYLHATLGPGTDHLILLAGSTHPGEERLLAEQFLLLRPRFPGLFLVVAPRHVERAPQVRAELESLGLHVASRTRPPDPASPRPDVLLLDTTGELHAWYALATVAFIGKSFCVGGGQNPAEAISAGVPALFGPRMENFAELTAQLLQVGAAVQLREPSGLAPACADLLADPARRQHMVTAGRACLAVHRGAAIRTADLLLAQRQKSACKSV